MLLYEELSRNIIGAAIEVHRALWPGFLESVYEHALEHEFTEREIPYANQAPIPVLYKQKQIGEYYADFIVYEKIILEIKATARLIAENEAQAIHYLAATQLRLALLLNFGSRSLQIKRIIK